MENSKRALSLRMYYRPILCCIATLIWLCLVIFIASHHEMWRDEARVLSQVRQVSNPLDLYRVIEYDGHPIMWFLLVYFGSLFSNSPLVLPITAILVSLIAVSVFMFKAPFQLWVKILFIFSALPLYEYTVMVRDYGLGIMLIFIIAAIYKDREKHPIILSLLLFILANVTVQTAIIAGFIMVMWILDQVLDGVKQKRFFTLKELYPFAIVTIGIIVCIIYTFPRDISIVTNIRGTFSLSGLWSAILDTFLNPQKTLPTLFPADIAEWVKAGMIFLLIVGLYKKPSALISAIGVLITFGVLFRLVYQSGYRHEGLFLIFIIALYWMTLLQPRININSKLLVLSVYLILPIFLLVSVNRAKNSVIADIKYERSASKSFCAYLSNSQEYYEAILLPEPDYLLESVPYYCNNDIYFIREHRFGTTVSWTTKANTQLSLAELLAEGKLLKAEYGKDVLIVLGHNNIDFTEDGSKDYSYNKNFSWTDKSYNEFLNSTKLLKFFDANPSDEKYSVYLVE